MGSTTSIRDNPSPAQQDIDDFLETQRELFIYEHTILPLADNIPDTPIRSLQVTDDTLSQSSPLRDTPTPVQQQSRLHPSQKNFIPQIFFATHNINGLCNDVTKLEHFLTYTAEHNIDIIVIIEINLPAKTTKFVHTKNSVIPVTGLALTIKSRDPAPVYLSRTT